MSRLTEQKMDEYEREIEFQLEGSLKLNNSNESIFLGHEKFVIVTEKGGLMEKSYDDLVEVELINEIPVHITTFNRVMDEWTKSNMTLGLCFEEAKVEVDMGLGHWNRERKVEGIEWDDNFEKEVVLKTIIERFKKAKPKLSVNKIFKNELVL